MIRALCLAPLLCSMKALAFPQPLMIEDKPADPAKLCQVFEQNHRGVSHLVPLGGGASFEPQSYHKAEVDWEHQRVRHVWASKQQASKESFVAYQAIESNQEKITVLCERGNNQMSTRSYVLGEIKVEGNKVISLGELDFLEGPFSLEHIMILEGNIIPDRISQPMHEQANQDA